MKERLPETLNTPANPSRPLEATVSPIAPLLIDQEERWQKGERVLVETYVEQRPSLRGDTPGMLGLIANEIIIRQKRGETPPAEEYRERFPQFASALELHFADNRTGADLALPKTLPLDKPTLDTVKRPVVGSPAAPDAVPGYEVKGVLGRGGMGVVYKALHRGLNRIVALKMILAGSHAGTEDVTRFRIEAESAARLQHPNVTQIYEVGESNGRPYFAMEYIEGCSLADKLDGTPQPPRVAAELIEILARAMQQAHERGIVHRDLKPANILLMNSTSEPGFTTSLGQPKISDFGLAKRLDADLRQTQTGAVLGTPSYMSPEQASGRIGDIGPCTDIYALGAILYDMLTGRPPFKSNTLADTLHQVQAMEPVSPARLEPNVPHDLETICLKCLRKETAKRYLTAQALATDLRRYLNGEPIEARPTPTWERVLKWSRRRPAAAALIVVSLISAIGLLAGGTWSYVKIRDSLQREEKQHQMADASFRDALNAVNEMLMQVGAVDLADVPQMEPVRKKLLSQAQSFMQKFLSERGDDPTVRLEAGRMYVYKGDIEDMLNNLPEAEQAYSRAISYLGAPDNSGNEDARKSLGLAYNNQGKLFKKMNNRFAEAEVSLRHALALREELANTFPNDPDGKRDLADSHNWLGAVLAEISGKYQESRQEYRQALALRAELANPSPENQRAQAQTLTNLGNLMKSTEPQKAEDQLREADKIQQKLADKFPTVPGYKRQLARSHHNLALMVWFNGNYLTAEQLLDDALKLLDDLTSHFPEVPEYRKEAAVVHRSKGDMLLGTEEFGKAEIEFRLALTIMDKLVADFAGVPFYRRMQAMLHYQLGVVQSQVRYRVEAKVRKVSVVLRRLLGDFPGLPGYHWREEKLSRQLTSLLDKVHSPVLVRKEVDQALHIQEKLVAEFPDVAEYHGDLAITCYNLARTLYQRNVGKILNKQRMLAEQEEAVACVRKAIGHDLTAWNANRKNLKFRNELVLDYKLLMAALLALGKNSDLPTYSEVAEAATQFSQTFPEDYNVYLDAAVSLSDCLAQAMQDNRLTEEQRKILAEDYSRKAVEFIGRGIKKGFKNFQELKDSPSYGPIRGREDFKRLLRDLEQTKSTDVG